MRFRTFFILMLFGGSIGVSYFYSEKVYAFYLKTYYITFLKKSKKDMMKKMYTLIDKKDKNSQKELSDYLDVLSLMYPGDKSVNYYKGINLMRVGKKLMGAEKIVSSLNGHPVDTKVLDEVVSVYYTNKHYSDVIYTVEKYMPTNNEITYYYGMSLFMKKKYKKAISILVKISNINEYRYNTNLHIGISYVELKQYRNALEYLEIARSYNKRDDQLNRNLIIVYSKLGMIKKADQLIRWIK